MEMEYKGDSKEIRRRRIYLTEAATIIEKRHQIAQDGSKDVRSDNEPNGPNAANAPENRRILGGVIFDTTYGNIKSGDTAPVPMRKRRKPKRGKRRKNTKKLRL